jgi:hypothetical protein
LAAGDGRIFRVEKNQKKRQKVLTFLGLARKTDKLPSGVAG